MRQAGLVFAGLRREAAESILRYAMKLAGVEGTTVHRALSGRRAQRVATADAERAEMLKALADARRALKTQ